jgi:hypothetical protein
MLKVVILNAIILNSIKFNVIVLNLFVQNVIALNVMSKTFKQPMEQKDYNKVNNCWNTKITFNVETSGDQNLNIYLNGVHFFNTVKD